MPGWHLKFKDDAFLIAEINTSAPFARLIRPAFAKPGIAQDQALDFLKPNSGIWHGPQPPHDSVIVQETDRPEEEFETWESRTEHPFQIRTPGPYIRKIDGSRWWLSPMNEEGPVEYDLSYFQLALTRLSK